MTAPVIASAFSAELAAGCAAQFLDRSRATAPPQGRMTAVIAAEHHLNEAVDTYQALRAGTLQPEAVLPGASLAEALEQAAREANEAADVLYAIMADALGNVTVEDAMALLASGDAP